MKKKNKLSIVILNWRDIGHPLAGGAEISLHEHAKFWMQNGAEVSWYSSSWSGAIRREVIDGIHIVRAGNHLTVHFLFLVSYLFGKVPKSDILIDSFHFVPYFSPLFCRKVKIFALINEIAGDLWYSNASRPFAFIGQKIEPFFLKVYKNITFITASDSTRRELVDFGIGERNIRIVHHGVTILNPENSVKKEKKPTILFLNRISEDKGIEDLLRAFLELEKENKDVQLWIVGKEEREGMLELLLNKYGLGKNVTYFGFVSQEEKFKLMKRAWVLAHPSKKEGWGLTVIEAASQGTPTVGYNVEGLRDSIQDNVTGVLTDPNSEELYRGVSSLLSDSKKRIDMAKNCVRWSEQFSWEKASKESWRIINEG